MIHCLPFKPARVGIARKKRECSQVLFLSLFLQFERNIVVLFIATIPLSITYKCDNGSIMENVYVS